MSRRLSWVAVGATGGFVAAVWMIGSVRRVRTAVQPASASETTNRVFAAIGEGRQAAGDYQQRVQERFDARLAPRAS